MRRHRTGRAIPLAGGWHAIRALVVLATLAIIVGTTAAPAVAAPAAVTGASIGRINHITRVALDLSDQVAFNVFTLADPYRVVIDLPDVEWQARALADGFDGPCGTVRYGEVQPGTWRVVLECAAPATIRDAQLYRPGDASGYRLVVEMALGSRSGILGYMATEAHRATEPTMAPAVAPAASASTTRSQARTEVRATGRDAAPTAATASPAQLPRSLIGESDRSAGPYAITPTRPAETAPAPAPAPGSALAMATPIPAAPTAAAKPAPAAAAAAAGGIGAAALTIPVPQRRPGTQRGPRIVVLDPGHGGADPGAIGLSGVYEKHITLAAAHEIRNALERLGGYKVFLTRSDDRIIPLRDRVEFARRVNADVFVSIHADSGTRRHLRGASVYTLSNTASDSEAAALAEKENKADLIAGIDLSRESAEVTNILIDLAQRETMNQSAALAGHVVRHLAAATNVLPNPHRFAGFAVLKAPDIPSVLIELGFLSNRHDEMILRQSQNRLRVAAAVAKAIDAYLTMTVSASAW